MLRDMLPAVGKRRWQRVSDAYDKNVRHLPEEEEEEEAEEHELPTDRTLLLHSTESSSTYRDLTATVEASRDTLHLRSSVDRALVEHEESCKMLTSASNANQSKPLCSSMHLRSVTPPLPVEKEIDCVHASWQGLRQILRKQFTPPFPFGKGLPPPEVLQRQNRLRRQSLEGVVMRMPPSDALGSRTNLVELRKMDGAVKNGIKKTAFASSSSKKMPRSKENMPCNLMQHSSLPKVAMKGMKPNVQITGFHDASVVAKKADPGLTQGKLRTFTCINTKETSILKKLKRQVRKEDNMALLANDIHL